MMKMMCWFYECCPYADGHLADRVGDGVPRILNWFVKYRLIYKEFKSAFFDIRQEQVVLRNFTPTVLEKIILQLPDFKLVDAVVHSVDLPSTGKHECSQLSSDNELTLLRSDLMEKVSSMEKFMKSSFELIFRALDIKNEPKVGISIGANDGDNSNEKDDETPNVSGTGDDQVNDPPNVGQQNDVVPEVDHISDNLMDDVGKATDCVGGDVIWHLVDAIGEKVNFVGDCVGGHVDVDSVAETLKDGAWKNFPNFDFLKFTQSSGENKDIEEGRNSQVDSDWSNFTDSEFSKFTQPFSDQKTQKEVDATTSDNVKGIEENMVVAPVMLDETPAIPRRLRKPAAVCESSFLSKFDSGCGKVKGQSSKCVENTQSRKHVLSIKYPFVKIIMERIDDMKVMLKFNKFVARPVYSDSVNALRKFFDYGVDIVKMIEWFFTLAYSGVTLTNSHIDVIFYYLRKKSKYGPACDSTLYKHFVENNRDVTLITQEHQIVEYMLGFFMRCNVPWNSVDNVLFLINLAEEFHWILARLSFKDQCIYVYDSMYGTRFWESRSDGLPVDNSFDIRIDCGVFVAAFAKYLLDGLEISNHLDNIDAIHTRYGVLLWNYEKKKQSQCAVSEDESTGRLLRKKEGVQQI
ncbi:uncharacterized protein LOC124887067 [Capsicum annuum]|uniref:uncharacterized protein LOC124887067 n=1 Tax=Capsicum annuum TaxID=4072 RepID=UPI001FB16C55|nr:uncharacterized protein LOC124887067 [Capsicum annuum]